MSELDTSTIVDRLPFELQARLEADPYFVDIPVVVAELGNVAKMLEARQAVMKNLTGKWGAAVIVLQIPEEEFRPNLQFGPMMLQPEFQVIEIVEQNASKTGTGKSYRQIARRVVKDFKGCIIEGLTKQIATRKPAIEPVSLADMYGQAARGVQVNLECLEASSDGGQQVALPVLVPVAGDVPQVAITCATPGATIYYTVDDSYPKPRTGRVYGGPITIPSGGCVVRACAYSEVMVASSVVRKTIWVEQVK